MKNQKPNDNKKEFQDSLTDHEIEQLRSWQKVTPAQRLAWLEEAIILSHKSGALQKYNDSKN